MQLMVLLMYVDSQYRFCSFSRKLRKPFNTAANFWPLALVLSESGGVNVRYLVPNKGWKWWEKWTIISLKLTRVLERVTWVMYNPHFFRSVSHVYVIWLYITYASSCFQSRYIEEIYEEQFCDVLCFSKKTYIYIYIYMFRWCRTPLHSFQHLRIPAVSGSVPISTSLQGEDMSGGRSHPHAARQSLGPFGGVKNQGNGGDGTVKPEKNIH